MISRTSSSKPLTGLSLSWLISQQQSGRQKCTICIVSVAITEKPNKTALSAHSVWQEWTAILQESVLPLSPLWTCNENSVSPSLVQRIKEHILLRLMTLTLIQIHARTGQFRQRYMLVLLDHFEFQQRLLLQCLTLSCLRQSSTEKRSALILLYSCQWHRKS